MDEPARARGRLHSRCRIEAGESAIGSTCDWLREFDRLAPSPSNYRRSRVQDGERALAELFDLGLVLGLQSIHGALWVTVPVMSLQNVSGNRGNRSMAVAMQRNMSHKEARLNKEMAGLSVSM